MTYYKCFILLKNDNGNINAIFMWKSNIKKINFNFSIQIKLTANDQKFLRTIQ